MSEENNNNEIEKRKNDIEDTEKAIKDGASLGKNVATGNVLGAAKDAIKLAKNKKVRRRLIIQSIMNILVPIIIIVFCASAVLVVFEAVGGAIKYVLETILGFFTIDFDFDTGAISIEQNKIDDIMQAIEDMGIDAESLKLTGDYPENASEEEKKEAMQKYIKKFYEAQAVTETLNYQHKDSTDNVTYGAVYVYRLNEDDTDGTNRYKLTYLDYEKMKKKQEAGDDSILKNFSIDDSGELVIAGKTTVKKEWTKEIDGQSPLTTKQEEVTLSLRTIDYKSAISQYTTKINFLINLTMISQNPEFVSALVDLIKDSRIEITIMDNVSTHEDLETYTYILNDRYKTIETTGSGQTLQEEEVIKETHQNIIEVTKKTTITATPSAHITYVKTWFCEQKISYNKGNATEPVPSKPIENKDENENAPPEGEIGSWKTEQIKTTTTTDYSTSYKEGTKGDVKFILGERGDAEKYKNKEIEEPTFVGLMETDFKIPNSERKEKAGSNLISGSEMLFSLLQKDSDLENMELIMRYALYLYSGKDYGVKELNGDIFGINDFNTVGLSGGSALAELLKSYENNDLREYMNGTSSDYNSVKDCVTQDKKQYKMYYTSNDGCLNFSYGIMVRNSKGVLNNEGYFKDEGIDLQSLMNQYDSGQDVYVDAEIIDRIYLKIINDRRNSLKEIFADKGVSMKSYQIDALVSISYQYENCGQYISGDDNIANLYKNYYEKGQIDEFKDRAQAQTDDGEREYIFVGSTDSERKEKIWTLFNEGRYILSDGTEIKSGSTLVEFALQFVGEDHSRFTNYNPSNGVADIWTGNDWCAMFVSYCYNECGLIPDILPRPFAACGEIYNLYKEGNSKVKIVGNIGVFAGVEKDNYIPSPGDIIFFNWGDARVASHTGIVVDCDGSTVYTVEGNTSDGDFYGWTSSKVLEKYYPLDSVSIVGYISLNN